MNIKRIIGDNIRGFRHRMNWTQEKLAVRSKLSPDYIGRLERGQKNIGAENLVRIAKALKIDPYLILKEDSYKNIL